MNLFIVLALLSWFAYTWWTSQNIHKQITELKKQNASFIDVRSASEFKALSAPGTLNIPLPELAARLKEIPRDVPVALFCASGARSSMAKILLLKNGFKNVYNVKKVSYVLKSM